MERLGFAWTDNLGLPETRQDLEPDYILFANKAEKEAVIEKDAAQRYRAAISLLEAKKVNHPLSQISTRQQRYPHQQIRDYLNEAEVLNWGILTNGNEWRLYCRDAKPSQFFAIDFGESIKSLENFKFFVALFSPTVFVSDAQGKRRNRGPIQLRSLLAKNRRTKTRLHIGDAELSNHAFMEST